MSLRCTACGRCCNSPPALTLAELFAHEALFVGCLAVSRAADGTPVFATQAHDYPSLARCPALADDGRCDIHETGKPGMCRVVPLDPRLPEAAQPVLLRRRFAEAAWMQADCLADGAREGHAPLLDDGGRIADGGYRADWLAHRAALADEGPAWRDELAAWLAPELARMPLRAPGGWLALSLVPVLAVRARRSPEEAARGRRYAGAQATLIDVTVARAIARRDVRDRPFTAELRRFGDHYRAWAGAA